MSTTEGWQAVTPADEVEEDDVVCVTACGRRLAVFHLEDGEYVVTDDRCTHGEASLADGYLDGDTIECPRHQGVFHVPTGKAMSPPVVDALPVYPTRVENGQVWVQLPD